MTTEMEYWALLERTAQAEHRVGELEAQLKEVSEAGDALAKAHLKKFYKSPSLHRALARWARIRSKK